MIGVYAFLGVCGFVGWMAFWENMCCERGWNLSFSVAMATGIPIGILVFLVQRYVW